MQNKSKFTGLSEQERLKKLAIMPDEDIDYSDWNASPCITIWTANYL